MKIKKSSNAIEKLTVEKHTTLCVTKELESGVDPKVCFKIDFDILKMQHESNSFDKNLVHMCTYKLAINAGQVEKGSVDLMQLHTFVNMMEKLKRLGKPPGPFFDNAYAYLNELEKEVNAENS